jgi:hypothetical protein
MSQYTRVLIAEIPYIASNENNNWPHSKGAALFFYKGVEICFGRSEYGDYYYHCWRDKDGKRIKLGDQAHLENCKAEIDKVLNKKDLTPIPFYN